MKKKSIVLIGITILLLVIGFIAYKFFNMYYYNINNLTDYNIMIKGLDFKNTIIVDSKEIEENEEYLSFENILVRNDFKEFTILEKQEDFIKYVLRDENDEVKAAFFIGEDYSYKKLFENSVSVFGYEEKNINTNGLKEYLEKNNIQDDIDLFKFIKKDSKVKNNVFTSTKTMKDRYSLHTLFYISFPSVKNITLIEGDYNGYILNINEDIKEVSIVNGDKRYIMTFVKKDYFDYNYIKELLNTVKIKEKEE